MFVVVSYTRNPETSDDTVNLWLNPNPSTFGAGAAPAPLVSGGLASGSELSSIASFIVRNVRDTSGPDPSIVFDELRIGSTWASVTPIPEPATLGLLLVGCLLMYARGRGR